MIYMLLVQKMINVLFVEVEEIIAVMPNMWFRRLTGESYEIK
jgi:hypothetical protein